MPIARHSLSRLAWIVAFTFLLAALLPALSHAMVPERSGAIMEICSSTGARVVLMSVDMSGDSRDEKSSGGVSSMNCPYCAIHHGAPDLPPAPAAWQPSTALRFEHPQLFLHAPRPLFAWASALARAPPTIA